MSRLLETLLDACRLRDCAENDRALEHICFRWFNGKCLECGRPWGGPRVEPIKTQAPFRESDFEPLTEADIALADGFGGGMVLDVDALRREGML